MPINLGTIFFSLKARDGEFRRSMRRSAEAVRRQERALKNLRRTVYRTNQRFRQFRSSVLSVRGAVGLLAGSAALGLLIKRQTEFGSTLIETSRQVGFSVESLQLLGRAFEGEGGRIESFNRGLRQFTRSIAEADRGVSTYAHQFEAMGVTLRNEQGQLRDSEEVLLDMADGLQGLSSQAQKTNAVMTLFGARNIAFQNILQNGRKALEGQLHSFRRLGLVATDEAQRLKDLNQSFSDLGNTLQVAAARGVAAASEELRRFNETLIRIGPEAISTLIKTVTRLVENLHVLQEIAIGVGAFFAGRWVVQTGRGVFAAKTFASGLVAVGKVLAGLRPSGRILLGLGAAVGYFALRTREAEQETSDFTKRLQENIDKAKEAEERVRAYQTAIGALRSDIEGLADTLRTKELTLLDRLLSKAELAQMRKDLQSFLNDFKGAQEEAEKAQKGAQSAADQAARLAAARRRAQALAPDFAGDVSARIARENRLVRQRLDLLKAEGEARTKLQAKFNVANQLVDQELALYKDVAEAKKKLSVATDKEQESARTAVLIAQDRLAAFKASLSQLDELARREFERLKLEQQIAKIEAERQQREAIRSSVLEANIAHYHQINGLINEANRLEKETLALQERLAGRKPAPVDRTQEGVQKRAGELGQEFIDSLLRGDQAAAAAATAALAGLNKYEQALARLIAAQQAFNNAQKQSQALTEAQRQTQENTVEQIRKQVDQELKRLKNANELATLKGEELFVAQQRIKLQERADELLAASVKTRNEGNVAAADALRDQADEIQRLIRGSEVLNDEQKKLLAVLLEQKKAIDKAAAAEKRRQEFAKQAAQALTKGLEAAVLSGKKFADVLRDVGKELLRISLRVLVLRRLGGFVTSLLTGTAKAATVAPGALTTAAGPTITGIEGFAGGGRIEAGQLALVGERGKELIQPVVPSLVTPNYKLRAALAGGAGAGGPSFTFNFNINSTDGPGVEAALNRRLPELLQGAAEVAEKVVRVSASRVTPFRRRVRRG